MFMDTNQKVVPAPVGSATVLQDASPPPPLPTVEPSNRVAGALVVGLLAAALIVTVGASLLRREKDEDEAKRQSHVAATTYSLRIYGQVVKWVAVAIGVVAVTQVFWLNAETAFISAVVGVLFALAMHAIGTLVGAIGVRLEALSGAAPSEAVTAHPDPATAPAASVSATAGAKTTAEPAAGPAPLWAPPPSRKKDDPSPGAVSAVSAEANTKKSDDPAQPIVAAPSPVFARKSDAVSSSDHSPPVAQKKPDEPSAPEHSSSVVQRRDDGVSSSVPTGTPVAQAPKATEDSSNVSGRPAPRTSRDAIKLAITLAMDADEYSRAAELLHLATPVAPSPTNGASAAAKRDVAT